MGRVESMRRPSPLNPGPQWLRVSELRVGAPLGPMSHVPRSAPRLLHGLPSIIPVPDPLRRALRPWLLFHPAGTREQHGHRERTQPCSGAPQLKTAQQNAVVSPCTVTSSAGCGPRARDIPMPPTSEAGDERGGACRSPFLPGTVFWSKGSSACIEGRRAAC